MPLGIGVCKTKSYRPLLFDVKIVLGAAVRKMIWLTLQRLR